MPSIVPNLEYDIFISYRHNDNRSGWVTDFVNALQEELAATIKEPLSIYFDKNPHDGLLETHNVDKSLEGKLRCLIFIPIVSQTYCDTKSFAWQHEFCAFNKLAKEDQFGRDIKLSNGNVASRILPVKIHDLDAEDKAIIENEIGGILRAIDFIYKEPGVNRPLKIADDRNQNQNKTDYGNQINKVANAVKEIITGLRNPQSVTSTAKSLPHTVKSASSSKKIAIVISSLVLLSILFIIYKQFAPQNTQPETHNLSKSIAVLPFVDLSEAKDQEWFGDGLTEEILNSLAHIDSLSVISRTSSFAFKNKNLPIQKIADSLHVNYVVEGSIRKASSGLRITAQLIRAKDDFHIWSNTYDRNPKDIFEVQSEIATKVAQALNVSLSASASLHMNWAGTDNPEAYLAFLKGTELFNKGHLFSAFNMEYLHQANAKFEEAMKLDENFPNPYVFHADYYLHFLQHSQRSYTTSISEKEAYEALTSDLDKAVMKAKTQGARDFYSLYRIEVSNDWSKMKPIADRLLNNPEAVHLFAFQNMAIGRLLVCLGYGEKIIDISKEILKLDPLSNSAYNDLAWALMYLGRYNEVAPELSTQENSIDFNNASINFDFTSTDVNFGKVLSLYKQGRIDECYEILQQRDSSSMRFYYPTLAMVLAKKGRIKEAKALMNRPMESMLDFSLLAVDEVLGRARQRGS